MRTTLAQRLPRLGSILVVIGLLAVQAGCGLALSDAERLQRAETAYASGDYRAAIIDTKSVLAGDPTNAAARVLLGRASVRSGDGSTGEIELRRAVELGVPNSSVASDLSMALLQQGKFGDVMDVEYSPAELAPEELASILVTRGEAQLGLGRPEQARETFTKILNDEPGNLRALLGVASSYISEENILQAQGVIETIQTVHAESPRAQVFVGLFNQRIGNFEASESSFRQALELSTTAGDTSERQQALAGLVESLLRQQKVDEAKSVLGELVDGYPNTLQTKFLAAQVAILQEDWSAAQQHLQEALSIADFPPAKMLLGAVQLQNENLAQAEAYLSAAVAEMPNNVRARQLLAEARVQMRRYREAQDILAPIAGSDASDVGILQTAAQASFLQNDLDSAAEYLRRAVEKDPLNSDLQFALAATLLQAGKTDEADAVLESIETSDSDDDEFRRQGLLVLTLLRAGDLDGAQDSVQTLVSGWESRASAHNISGRVLLVSGDVASARMSFETALQLDPSDQESQRFLAALDEQQEDWDSAGQRYEQVLSVNSEADWAMLGLARLAAKSGNLEQAVLWLERTLQITPENAGAVMLLARLQTGNREYELAEGILRQGIKDAGESAELMSMLGNVLFLRRNLDESAEAFKAATELRPNSPGYRIDLAMVEAWRGNAGSALEILDAIDRDAIFSRLAPAVIYASLKARDGDFDDALSMASRLQELYPEASRPIALEAEIHAVAGDLEQAEATYDKALSTEMTRATVIRAHELKRRKDSTDAGAVLTEYLDEKPDDTAVRIILADYLTARNDMRAAIREYERVVAERPNDGAALNNLAWSYHLVDDPRAADTARRAYAAMPDNGSVLDTYGWILLQDGEAEQASNLLAKAVLITPENAVIQYHYAVSLARQGRTSEARNTLEEALASGQLGINRAEAEALLAELN